MPRIVYNKLIRDRIPDIIATAGKQAHVTHLDDADFAQALVAKLSEEAQEVATAVASGDRHDILTELADVATVLEAIRELCEIDAEDVATVQAERDRTRGRFDKRLWLDWVAE